MNILGIESSCDETAAAIQSNKELLSNIVASQVKDHAPFWGVVPEIASRKHLELIIPVINKAISDAKLSLNDIELIAVTQGPGLIGALLVGVQVAKSIAYACNLPLVGVNHLHAHLWSIFLEKQYPSFPFIGLVVSGGHTNLYKVDEDHFQLLGQSRDDAAGEAFDKIAKLLNLEYPGGVIIDNLSKKGNPNAIQFPRAFLKEDSFEFSFSGLKTSVINFVRSHKIIKDGEIVELNPHLIKKNRISQDKSMPEVSIYDLCASFQEAIIEILVEKSFLAARRFNISDIVIAGGVAANSRLREKMEERSKKEGIRFYVPKPSLCTDNAAMVASYGYFLFSKQKHNKNFIFMNPFSR